MNSRLELLMAVARLQEDDADGQRSPRGAGR